jgi:hypothetical protein
MAKWMKVTGKIIRKLMRVVFFMLLQSESSKVEVSQFEWSPVYKGYIKKKNEPQ